MVITLLQPEPNNPCRYRVYIDGEFIFSVHEDVIVKYRLTVGQRWDPALLPEVLKEENEARARADALRFLSYKPRTGEEVRWHLEHHGFHEESIVHVLAYLQKHGYLDDALYAQMYAEERLNKSFGPYRIAQELKMKGLERGLIERALSRFEEEEIYRQARRLAEKKMAALSSLEKDKSQAKVARYLQYRGYRQDLISAVVKELFS